MDEKSVEETIEKPVEEAAGEPAAPRKGGKLRSFGKYLGLSVLFCAILLGMIWGLGRILQPKDNTKESGMLESRAYGYLAEPKDSLDVIFLGDSLCSTSFSPMEIWKQTGVASYACASNGSQLSYTYKILDDVLQTQSPKVVVLETEVLFTPSNIEKTIKQAVKDTFTLIEYHHRWKVFSLDELFTTTTYDQVSYLKGFNPKALTEKADTTGYMASTDQVEMPDDFNQLMFKAIVDLCQRNGIQLVLVSAPHTQGWGYARHNGCQALADQYGLTYIDLNEQDEDASEGSAEKAEGDKHGKGGESGAEGKGAELDESEAEAGKSEGKDGKGDKSAAEGSKSEGKGDKSATEDKEAEGTSEGSKGAKAVDGGKGGKHGKHVDIDWTTDSRDAGIHLNYRGAQKVSDWMAAYLSEELGMPDHRGEEAYAAWDDCLTQYEAYMEEVRNDPEGHDVLGTDVF